MALAIYDRVLQTGTANTTVSFTLSGSVTGYQSFAAVGNGNTTYYAAADNSGNWETGLGTYSTSGPTLTRTTVSQSSNSNTAVTFSGTVTIWVDYPASFSVYQGGPLGTPSSGVATNLTGTASGLTVGSATTASSVTGGYVSSAVAGTAISVSGATGAVTINNTGVTSAVAGTGISVSGATGAVTISIPQAITTSSSVQFGSFGVGTTASGTTGEIRATNNVTAYYSSDRQFKENIKPIFAALQKVEYIGGKTFSWTQSYLDAKGGEDGYFVQKDDFGVVAQDVQSVFPLAVRTRKDGTLAVDYAKLVALAFAAIAELKVEVDALKGK
jgi:hypothetical protein